MIDRRHFLAAGAASGCAASLVSSASAEDAPASLAAGDVVLFQGDSITDAGRDRKSQNPNDARALGRGYAANIAGGLLRDHAALGLKVFNRGVGGNKVPDLAARWDADCIDLQPAILSILIGVNDIWHKLNGRYDGTPEVYRDGFAALLERTAKALPDTTIVICEPFVLRCGAVNDSWFPEFETRRQFAEDVAKEAGLTWVPFQKTFDEAVAAGTEPAYWAGDGVHPSVAGHALMAECWRKCVGV